jgi:radical SAM protein with 4Fe4S-binding SPASM domain
MSLTEAQLEERKHAVGGSDVPAIYDMLPWYCRKKLWFEKTGAEPDWDDDSKEKIFARGHAIEAIAAEYYAEATGQTLRRENVMAYIKDKPHCGVHIDRHIVAFDDRGPGVMEVKNVASKFEFYRLKETGVREAYITQLQWGMHVKGWKWGVFVIFCSELWEWIQIELEYDPDFGAALELKVDEFWHEVTNNIEQQGLSDDDSRCKNCNFRPTCKGDYNLDQTERTGADADLIDRPDLAEAVRAWDEIDKIVKEAKPLLDEAKEHIKGLIGEDEAMITDGFKIYFKKSTRNSIDAKMLRALYPDEAKECTKTTPVRSLKKYPV